ncbi:MAG: hypothetical protein IKT25_06860 [Firmicutes bacterium]|nr:hypothetical protein [Bacillota bacterium]
MTERYRYSLIRGGGFDRICNENYGEERMRPILQDLLDKAHYGVLFLERRRNGYTDKQVESFYEMIEDHLTYSFLTNRSYMGVHGNSGAFVFKMDEEMLETLVELSENNLFFHDEFGQVSSPFWDLCLFREDGSLVLGTVSHEYDADLYLTEEEMERLGLDVEFRKEKLEFEAASLAKFTIPLYDEEK